MSSILMENQTFNNEVPFCTVYTKESKRQLEDVFLKNRISYYCEWQDRSFWSRLFAGRSNKNRINCVIRINNAEVERARELVADIRDIKLKDGKENNGKGTIEETISKETEN